LAFLIIFIAARQIISGLDLIYRIGLRFVIRRNYETDPACASFTDEGVQIPFNVFSRKVYEIVKKNLKVLSKHSE